MPIGRDASRLFAAACCVAAMLTAPASAQPLPDTPAGRYVRDWLEAVDSGDVRRVQALDPRAVRFFRETGGLEFVRLESASETVVTALLRTRLTGNYVRTTWVFDPSTPGKVLTVRAVPTDPPPGAPATARLSDAALGEHLRDFLERSDFSGAVLVARRGRPVFSAARGLADRERQVPNTLESRFRVGSMDKMFTAVAVLQLVQAGKVELDAPVGTYLKDYPNADFARTVTVRQLLTHTGGAGDIFGPQYFARRLEVKTLHDYVGLYGTRAPEFTPGTNWRYANYGFILLGRIVEAASGQSYYDYVRDRIFAPAGMTGAGFEPEDAAVERRVVPYAIGPEGPRSTADTLPYRGTSAGGGYATVGDFLAFADALTRHRLLDAQHYRLLTTKQANGGYAFGFEDGSRDGVRIFGHSGGAPGQNGYFRVVGDGELVVVALTNVAPPPRASQVATLVLARAIVQRPDGKVAAIGPGPAPAPSAVERLAAFKANDGDGDGRLDKAEYRRVLTALAYPERTEAWFAERDSDKDGFISADEFRGGPTR